MKYVEYLESTGDQHIPLKLDFTNNTRIVMDMMVKSTLDSYFLGNAPKGLNRIGNGIGFVNMTGTGVNPSYGTLDVRTVMDFTLTGKLYFDGEEVHDFTNENPDYDAENPEYKVAVFGKDNTFETTGFRLYELKWYEGDELILHLKPCVDDNNVGCLYDLVSETYYRCEKATYEPFILGKFIDSLFLFANNNEGTAEDLGYYRLYNMKIDGDSEGVESGIDYVDCLIGDNASWIDTGITVATGYQIDVTFMLTDKTSYSNIGGAIYGSANPITNASDSTYGTSLAYIWNNTIAIRDNGSGGANSHYGSLNINESTCLNNKYALSRKLVNVSNKNKIYLMSNNNGTRAEYIATSSLRVYDFKIYNDSNTLLIHLRPCLDTEGIPCMYDEVSGEYFHNQGTGTFGYKKTIRDFQPVLDSNGMPCLMDKVNKKYYYDKNGGAFSCRDNVKYRQLEYIKGDYNSYIDTGLIANQMHGYKIEIKFKRVTDYSKGNQIVFGSSDGHFDSASTNAHLRYNYYAYPQGLSFSDEDRTAMYNPSVDTILDVDFTINTPTSSSSFYLFAGNNKNTPLGTCDATIYYWKVYDTNNNLIQHLVPAIDNNGAIGMYDLVTQQFFYNQGDGEFSYGIEELECPKVNYVEYLDNNGATTYKLGIQVNTGDIIGVKYKFMFTDDTVSGQTSILSTTDGISGGSGWVYFTPVLNGSDFYTRDGWGTSQETYKINETWVRNKIYEVEINTTSNKFIVNGEEICETKTAPSSTWYPSLYLFSNMNNYAISNMMFYYLDVYKNHELVGSFKPAIDENGVICIYNSITQTYIYQLKNGKVDIGNPSYTPISYIESNGTQYIDTEVVPTDNTYIDIDYRACEIKVTGDTGQVEYLQGDKQSWINTGIKANFHYKYEIVVQDEAEDDYDIYIGVDNNFYVGKYNKGLKFQYDYSPEYSSGDVDSTNKVTITVDRHSMYVNGELSAEHSSNYSPGSFSSSIALFADASGSSKSNAKIYSVKMWDNNGTLVFDGIPMLNNGVPCMQNAVTGELLYNQGTGTFGHGELMASSSAKNYLMNDYYIETTYKFKETDTTIEPKLNTSEGATLTLGDTYINYLSEDEIDQATNDGWTIV